jgi:Restriction endonuclease
MLEVVPGVAAMTIIPVACIAIAAEEAAKGCAAGAYWGTAWVFSILDASCILWHYLDIELSALGVFQASCAVLVTLVLSCGLRIPLDPSIDWLSMTCEFLANVQTGPDDHSSAFAINDDTEAEEVAAAWLRRFGYRDARVSDKSPSGNDGGIDVYSTRAVAQVKFWLTKRGNQPDVQQLVGSAEPGQRIFFFAVVGYTRPAIEWDLRSDHRVGLFLLRKDGNIIALNFEAKKTLWLAPFRIPLSSLERHPGGILSAVACLISCLSGSALCLGIGVNLLATSSARTDNAGQAAVAITLSVFFLFMLLLTGSSILLRLMRGCSAYLRKRQWPGWKSIFMDPRRHAIFDDSIYPASLFYGYDLGFMRAVILSFDIWAKVQARRRRWAILLNVRRVDGH